MGRACPDQARVEHVLGTATARAGVAWAVGMARPVWAEPYLARAGHVSARSF